MRCSPTSQLMQAAPVVPTRKTCGEDETFTVDAPIATVSQTAIALTHTTAAAKANRA